VSKTPRTDAAELEANIGVTHFDHKDLSAAYHFARQLERELNAANDRIKRLEEALAWYEYTVLNCYCHGSEGDAARDALRKDQGRKAKEAKP
jgi:hypothetical protein